MNDDLISRSALKEAIREWRYHGYYDKLIEVINNVPTVDVMPFASVTFNKDELEQIVRDKVIEPIKNGELVVKEKRPQGEWITDERGYVCSECGALHSDDYPFCHMCGADMRGGA